MGPHRKIIFRGQICGQRKQYTWDSSKLPRNSEHLVERNIFLKKECKWFFLLHLGSKFYQSWTRETAGTFWCRPVIIFQKHVIVIQRYHFAHRSNSMCRLCITSMRPSSNENIFRVTGPLCVEFTGHRWISPHKGSDADLGWFLWSAPE